MPCRFLVALEDNYSYNPYHNRMHAADVLRTLHVIMTRGGVRQVRTQATNCARINLLKCTRVCYKYHACGLLCDDARVQGCYEKCTLDESVRAFQLVTVLVRVAGVAGYVIHMDGRTCKGMVLVSIVVCQENYTCITQCTFRRTQVFMMRVGCAGWTAPYCHEDRQFGRTIA